MRCCFPLEEREGESARMLHKGYGQVMFLLATTAVLLCGRSFEHGQPARRWVSPGSRQHNGLTRADGSAAARGTAFSVWSARDTSPWSSRRAPVAGVVDGSAGEPPPLRSSLAMLPIVAADLGLRGLFCRLGWSFPSSVAGMVALFAGLAGLDRVAPAYAERGVRLLEPGSTQFMAWLPIAFVPGIIAWVQLPVARLLGSSSSLSGVVVAAAQLEAARMDYSRSPSLTGTLASLGAGGTKTRVAVKVAKLLLTVAGGWLVNLGSAAAIFTVLSPSSPSPVSSAASFPTAGTAGAAPSLSVTQPAAGTSATGFFSARLVRRLGVGTMVSGSSVYVIFFLLFLSALCPLSWSFPFAFPFCHTFYMSPLFVALVTALVAMCASMGLGGMFGFAAGRLVVSPGGTFAPSCPPWVAVLLPLVTSAAVPVAAACGFGGPQLVASMAEDGDLMFRLLGPAVLSFAAPLFRIRDLIFLNAKLVVGGSVACASTALFGTALGCRLLGIPKAFEMALQTKSQAEANKSLVSRLGKALRFLSPLHDNKAHLRSPTVAASLGAYASNAIAGVLVVTGVLGATFGAQVLDVLGVRNQVVRGCVQGGPLNVLGMAATSEQDTPRDGRVLDTATDASSIRDLSTATMILTGVAGAVLVNIPPVRSALLSIALGSSTAEAAVP